MKPFPLIFWLNLNILSKDNDPIAPQTKKLWDFEKIVLQHFSVKPKRSRNRDLFVYYVFIFIFVNVITKRILLEKNHMYQNQPTLGSMNAQRGEGESKFLGGSMNEQSGKEIAMLRGP